MEQTHPSPCGFPDVIPCICPREPLVPLGRTLASRQRPAGWVAVYAEVVAGTRWWRVECKIPHEPNSVGRWWKATWPKALESALEHLAGHAVRRVPLRPIEEVAAGEG